MGSGSQPPSSTQLLLSPARTQQSRELRTALPRDAELRSPTRHSWEATRKPQNHRDGLRAPSYHARAKAALGQAAGRGSARHPPCPAQPRESLTQEAVGALPARTVTLGSAAPHGSWRVLHPSPCSPSMGAAQFPSLCFGGAFGWPPQHSAQPQRFGSARAEGTGRSRNRFIATRSTANSTGRAPRRSPAAVSSPHPTRHQEGTQATEGGEWRQVPAHLPSHPPLSNRREGLEHNSQSN